MATKQLIYVGTARTETGLRKEIVRTTEFPTHRRYGSKFFALTGPFKTIRGAKALVHYGHHDNPHIQHVSDAERIGLKYAAELKDMPEFSLSA